MIRWIRNLFKAQPKRVDDSTRAAEEREERVRERLMLLTATVDMNERRDRDEPR